MNIQLCVANAADFGFAQALYFETMRSMIEPLFGWDQTHQEQSFAKWFKLDEARIITAEGRDVGWAQWRVDECAIFLGSLYIAPEIQGQGIGTHVLRTLLAEGRQSSKEVTLAVMKVNPAVHLYERLGFWITHQDEYKLYMQADSRT